MAQMSNYISLTELKVGLQFDREIIPVGRLASRSYRIYFEYDDDFIQSNLEISPLKLPLERGLKEFDLHPFDGLAGVFNDSLPDGWGRLLFDRYIRSQNLLPDEFSPLDRLAHVGITGLGALVYQPNYNSDQKDQNDLDLDILSEQTQEVLKGQTSDVLQELIDLNGSSAGARPKALIGVNKEKTAIISGSAHLDEAYDHWMVKFANSTDGLDAGAIEYVYALMAKEAGIEMTPTHLFKAEYGAGYFATQRFDRIKNRRLHMHTASGLLHNNFRLPSLDYEDLITLTGALTQDVREVEKMYRLAVFNVMAHNRDDHAKNFSYLMNETGQWTLSPAYDLTFSSGPRGHQSTMVMREGQNPTIDHLIKLGEIAGLKKQASKQIIDQTRYALTLWKNLAKTYGVTNANIKLIASRMI